MARAWSDSQVILTYSLLSTGSMVTFRMSSCPYAPTACPCGHAQEVLISSTLDCWPPGSHSECPRASLTSDYWTPRSHSHILSSNHRIPQSQLGCSNVPCEGLVPPARQCCPHNEVPSRGEGLCAGVGEVSSRQQLLSPTPGAGVSHSITAQSV